MKSEHISICICTFKRPRLLERLLKKLELQITDSLFSYSVVVVDNDSQQSGRNVVESFRNYGSIPVEYYHEPERSISLARNMAVRNSKGDYIAFIDDDEFPEQGWILKLYRALKEYQCDGVLGPVIPHFEEEPPAWLMKGRLLERKSFKTGEVIKDSRYTRTGNVLLLKELFGNKEQWFDPKYGRSGGGDVVFFKKMLEKGKVFMWCNEASVYETVPLERQEKLYYIKRAFTRGMANSWVNPLLSLGTAKSLLAILLYSSGLPFFLLAGLHLFMRYLVKDCDHIGKILGYFRINIVRERPY